LKLVLPLSTGAVLSNLIGLEVTEVVLQFHNLSQILGLDTVQVEEEPSSVIVHQVELAQLAIPTQASE
jgi:hypothetical protein